jgi:hypothetical protein
MTISAEYLAGFFDGEGCINIAVRGRAKQVVLRIMLVNTDYEFLKEVQSEYGGRLSRRQHKAKPHWKPFCCVTWTNNHAARFLGVLAPYLRVKRKQVDLAIEFLEFQFRPRRERCDIITVPCSGMKNGRRNYMRRSEATLQGERRFRERMGELNMKGVRRG